MTCWKDLPDIIFGDILIMMGLNSLEQTSSQMPTGLPGMECDDSSADQIQFF